MARPLRVLGAAVVALILLAGVAAGSIGFRYRENWNRRYDFPGTPLAVALQTDSAQLAEGLRLMRIRGCPGCHGPDLGGKVFFEERWIARVVAPNLTRITQQYSDHELERAIRHGLKPDSTSVFEMPSDMFYHLSDGDLAAIIAAIRSLPLVDRDLGRTTNGPIGWWEIATGRVEPVAPRIPHDSARLDDGIASGDVLARGRYLAMTVCSECHGMDLQGGGRTPALSIVAGYTEEAFRVLMRTGRPLDGRQLALMANVAVSRFAHFTDAEVSAVYAYLRTLAGRSS